MVYSSVVGVADCTESVSMPECRICNNLAGNEIFTAREMMFGTSDEFDYFECARCGCLQIGTIPPDLSPYYPPEYYSFSLPRPVALKRYFQRQHGRFTLGKSGALGWLLNRRVSRTFATVALQKVPGQGESRLENLTALFYP